MILLINKFLIHILIINFLGLLNHFSSNCKEQPPQNLMPIKNATTLVNDTIPFEAQLFPSVLNLHFEKNIFFVQKRVAEGVLQSQFLLQQIAQTVTIPPQTYHYLNKKIYYHWYAMYFEISQNYLLLEYQKSITEQNIPNLIIEIQLQTNNQFHQKICKFVQNDTAWLECDVHASCVTQYLSWLSFLNKYIELNSKKDFYEDLRLKYQHVIENFHPSVYPLAFATLHSDLRDRGILNCNWLPIIKEIKNLNLSKNAIFKSSGMEEIMDKLLTYDKGNSLPNLIFTDSNNQIIRMKDYEDKNVLLYLYRRLNNTDTAMMQTIQDLQLLQKKYARQQFVVIMAKVKNFNNMGYSPPSDTQEQKPMPNIITLTFDYNGNIKYYPALLKENFFHNEYCILLTKKNIIHLLDCPKCINLQAEVAQMLTNK